MPHTHTPFEARLRAVAETVEGRLAALLDDAPRAGEPARPERLMAAMRHAALAGGKRLRPFLAVEATRLLGGPEEAGLRAGLAIELIHCYSLVHDDLPAMDDDDLRRGKPTVHVAFDDATAILAGDALLTLAFEVATEDGPDAPPAIRAALAAAIARAAGLAGMVGGQMLDLAAEGRWGPRTPGEDEIRRLQAMKTGALLAVSAEAGAIAAGAAPEHRARLLAYGRALGAAFQIADDILDREATAEALGKAVGKDAQRGKGTLVDALGMDAARAECDRLVAEAEAALAPWGAGASVLIEAARFTAARKA
ncbi:polyprenyl synthetase family protein [Salinarimonas chemoclinalis]|uniref:polyprenyl synthetase family protein n=1 Tax=Salinarimonas chemoclinalis TaxID=3241599 RepID=UPI0035584DBC